MNLFPGGEVNVGSRFEVGRMLEKIFRDLTG